MIAEVRNNRDALSQLCDTYAVRRLDLFGSAATEEHFDPATSDLDFLVEFDPHDCLGPADQYFGLMNDLKAMFNRDIHLVTARSMRNPYFIKSVNATRKSIYGSQSTEVA